MRQLEDTARSFSGVGEAYAVQAGREMRIMVRPEALDDLGVHSNSAATSPSASKRSMEYPGQIKVTVVREMRAVEYAK